MTNTEDKSYGNYSESEIKSIASVAHNMTHQQKLALIDEIIQITQSRMTATEDSAEWEHIVNAEYAIQECKELDEREQAKADAAENHPFWDSGDAYIDYPRVW
jgi:Mlc titration factor MtfA (ptsG expression regulator)